MQQNAIGKYDRSTPCDDILQMYTIQDLEHIASDEFYFYYVKDGLSRGKQI